MDITTLTILCLATYRLAGLLADENGPWDILENFRYFIGVRYDERSTRYGTNVFANGILCVYCNSVWLGILFTVLYFTVPFAVVLALPFALSGFVTFVYTRSW